jgi:hypothetical protein
MGSQRVAASGAYAIANLPAGDYSSSRLPYEDTTDWTSPAMLERLSRVATGDHHPSRWRNDHWICEPRRYDDEAEPGSCRRGGDLSWSPSSSPRERNRSAITPFDGHGHGGDRRRGDDRRPGAEAEPSRARGAATVDTAARRLTIVTDDAGRFVFKNLADDRYQSPPTRIRIWRLRTARGALAESWYRDLESPTGQQGINRDRRWCAAPC